MNHSRIAHHVVSSFLAGSAQSERDVVLAAATHRDFPARTVVTEEGDPASHFFLLVSGRARYLYLTEQDRKVILHWMLPGDVIGGMAMLAKLTPYIVSSETVRRSSMLIWKRDTIRHLFKRYPKPVPLTLRISPPAAY